MAKVERNGSPKGQSVAFTLSSDGSIELVHGSMTALAISNGDLVLVRLGGYRQREHQIRKRVLKLIKGMLESTGQKAVVMVVPADFHFEVLPHEKATELLQELTRRKADSNDDDCGVDEGKPR